jgi:hypothetical protein
MKLKITIDRWHTTVMMQILEMDERFRAQPYSDNFFYVASNGIVVKSSMKPYLGARQIFLRGENSECDYLITSMEFDTEQNAQEYLDEVKDALREWSENWSGWAEEKQRDNVFVF